MTTEEKAQIAKTTVARAAWIVIAGMMVSRLLGYGRAKAIAFGFGMTWQTDAFTNAFNVPDTLYFLVSGGALTASFIPVFTRYILKNEHEEAWRVTSILLNLMLTVVVIGVSLGIIFAPLLVRVIAPGYIHDPQRFNLCVQLVRILYPMVFFTSIAALCNGILHSFNHFTAPSLSWSIYNVAIIAAAFLLAKPFGIRGLCYGVLAGTVGMVLVQAPVIVKKGFRYQFSLDLKHPGVREALRLFFPAMLGLAITQVNLLILPNLFGTYFEHGVVTALFNANRLLMLPLGMFGSALAMAVFPALTRHAANELDREFKETLTKGIRITFLFSIPSTVALIAMGLPICRILFQGGAFTLKDSQRTAAVLTFYAIGLVGHSAVQVITRGFYALKDTKTPVQVGIVTVCLITIPVCIYSINSSLAWRGLPLAVSMTTLVNSVVLYILLRRKIGGLDTKGILISFAKVVFAAAAMWAVTLIMMNVLNSVIPAKTLSATALNLFVTGSVATAVFGGIVLALRVPEAGLVLNSFVGRLRRRA